MGLGLALGLGSGLGLGLGALKSSGPTSWLTRTSAVTAVARAGPHSNCSETWDSSPSATPAWCEEGLGLGSESGLGLGLGVGLGLGLGLPA